MLLSRGGLRGSFLPLAFLIVCPGLLLCNNFSGCKRQLSSMG